MEPDWVDNSVTPEERKHIFPYLNGRDLNQTSRNLKVVDALEISEIQLRQAYPHLYQHLRHFVYPERVQNNRKSYRDNWWIFAEPRREIRPALSSISRYIGTARTAKHRVFSFIDGGTVAESEIVVFGLDTAFALGVLSCSIHLIWALCLGGTLEDRPRYNNSLCFDPFPFPDASDTQKQTIGAIAEELDAHRKRVLEDHPHLTLTGLYNVLERLKSGAGRDDLNDKERRIFDDGLVLIIKELHDNLDAAVADAYGWPVDLAEEEVLARLVALNKERAKEEKRGNVRWLRPDYQIPRFGSDKEKAEQIEADFGEAAVAKAGPKPGFPTDERDQTPAVLHQLMEADGPLDAAAIAAGFKQGRKCLGSVNAVLASLFRMGLVSTPDGKRFAFRRAA